VTPARRRIGLTNAGTCRRLSSWMITGKSSDLTLPRVESLQPPAVMTLRTQSESTPYVSATTQPSGTRKTLTGVRKWCPDRRPLCSMIPNPGRRPATGAAKWFVKRRLNRATGRGMVKSV
jgi:hypothetical protein